jgi:hypothetical protein
VGYIYAKILFNRREKDASDPGKHIVEKFMKQASKLTALRKLEIKLTG